MSLPKKITPCPIIDAIFEFRFKSNLPSEAVFGIFYDKLKMHFPNVEKLPILQLPEQIRSKDPELKEKPHFRLSDGFYKIQIGPNVFSVTSPNGYEGWSKFSNTILAALKTISGLGAINEIYRLGLRYINFFESDIYEKMNLQILLSSEQLKSQPLIFRTEFGEANFKNVLQVTNNVTLTRNSKKLSGSIIDIDTIKEGEVIKLFEEQDSLLEEAHSTEKKLFFSLLNDDFVQELNPEY